MIQILIGDVLTKLKSLPDKSVHCVITSPPYWGLRDYEVEGQIGLEATYQEHIEKIVEVFAEIWRVLRDDGTVWLNYGDCYATTPNGRKAVDVVDDDRCFRDKPFSTIQGVLKEKDLCLMAARVMIALQEWNSEQDKDLPEYDPSKRWYVRSEIVWNKPNPMPESVTDRPANAHEKVYLLTKSPQYFYDAAAVRVPTDSSSGTRNLRNVWEITPTPFKEAHFATFPPKLVEPCIKAGTSEKGVCPNCGAPYVRIVEKTLVTTPKSAKKNVVDGRDLLTSNDQGSNRARDGHVPGMATDVKTVGWEKTCECKHTSIARAVVLDPFGGAGTTALVADQLQRSAILIELNPEYAELARNRLQADGGLLTAVHMEAAE